MKKIYLLLLVGLIITISKTGFSQTENDPVYIEKISNGDKSIDLTVGLYPTTSYWNETDGYTSFTFRVLNNSTTTFDWDNYKVYIMLKDGTLFYNYKTKAETGEFTCIYSVESTKAHSQTVCFAQKFDTSNIDKVYVSFGDNQFFSLVYYAGKE